MFYTAAGAALDNRTAARHLFAVASLLASQGANPYRVRAYRRAAVGLLRLSEEAHQHTTPEGELDLPGLGPRLRRKLGELVTEGSMRFHVDLLAELPQPLRDLLSIPGVGPRTARRLMDDLGVRTVWGVAHAARQGRLRTLPGIGLRREQQVGTAAEQLLAASAQLTGVDQDAGFSRRAESAPRAEWPRPEAA